MGKVRNVVRWSKAEKDGVIARAVELYFRDGLRPSFQKAQDILPPRRRGKGWGREKVWKDAVNVRIEEVRAELAKQAAAAPPPVPLPVVELPAEAPTLNVAPNPAGDLFNALVAVVESEGFKRILAVLRPEPDSDLLDRMEAMEMAVSELADHLPGVAPERTIIAPTIAAPPAPETERARRERVLVVGLLGAQANRIKKQFGNRYDLRFAGSTEAVSMIRDRAKYADRIVALVTFMNHSMEAALRDAKPSTTAYVRVNGGVEAVARALET